MCAKTVPIIGIVLHFRSPKMTIACLRSQLDEGIDEVFVVDNSADAGRSVADMQNELDALANDGFVVRILTPKDNLGFASGVNFALSHLESRQRPHVLLINSDAKLSKGSVDHMRRSLATAALVAPRISQRGREPSAPVAYYDRLLALITWSPRLMPIPYLSGCCLLIRCDHVKSLVFDQDFFFYGEDVMLGFECKRKEIIFRECEEAVVLHDTSASAKNGSLFYEYHISRSHWLLALKLARSPIEAFLFVLVRCGTLPLRALVRCVRFRSIVAWRGLLAATVDVVRGECRKFTPGVIFDQPDD